MDSTNKMHEVHSEVDELAKFFKFNRKKTAVSVHEKLTGFESEYATLSGKYEGLNNVHLILSEEHEQLGSEYTLVTQENRSLSQRHDALANSHREVTTKYELISSILGAKSLDKEAMNVFNDLVAGDFIAFANEEGSLAEEAHALLMLQNAQREMQLISSFPGIYNKTIVAVGGGFSAGKSEFISSFFLDAEVRLPIGIKPVTAIPTYISNGDNHLIKGYSYQGGSTNISSELYAELSHDFIRSFNFNLKEIMPMMAIETKLKDYENICFIDTPGYNPTNTGTTGEDYQVAIEYLENANVLLWVIGVDASEGAIPNSDLNFLENLCLENKKLFIVANKADLKSPDDMENILDYFEEMLDEYDIDYAGISAYSSIGKREISFRKQSLFDLLDEIDDPISANESVDKVISELDKVFDMYEVAINEQLKWTQGIQKSLKSLELDFMQDGMDIYESERASQRIETIKKTFSTRELEKQLKTLAALKEKMIAAAKNVLNDSLPSLTTKTGG